MSNHTQENEEKKRKKEHEAWVRLYARWEKEKREKQFRNDIKNQYLSLPHTNQS